MRRYVFCAGGRSKAASVGEYVYRKFIDAAGALKQCLQGQPSGGFAATSLEREVLGRPFVNKYACVRAYLWACLIPKFMTMRLQPPTASLSAPLKGGLQEGGWQRKIGRECWKNV